MSHYLWIAIIITTVTIAVHGLLFWWFLCKKEKPAPKNDTEEE